MFTVFQGTYKILNTTLDTKHLPFLQDTKGSISFRVVGKVADNPITKFIAQFAYSGGYRRQ